MDRFSPVIPAYTRVLVLPVGKVDKDVLQSILEYLNKHSSITPLQDLLSLAGQDDFLLSPLHFKQGSLLLNFTTSDVPEQQRQLSPFELWRETLLVLGIASLSNDEITQRDAALKRAADELRDKHGRVVHRHLFVLDNDGAGSRDTSKPGVTFISSDFANDTSTLQHAVKDLAVQFLRELSTYAKAMQASPSIQTPGQPVQGFLRSMLLQDDGRPKSNHGEPRSPDDLESSSRPTSKDFMPAPPMPPPATSFDQMNVTNTLARSDSHGSRRSKSRPRTTSFDRVPVHALSKEKIKDRGKARVGVVIGSIYLLSGHWSEALKILVDNTIRLRALSDHIWHAKGLENIFVCLLLHAWRGIEFQVPAICYQLSDKVRDRFSKALVAELKEKGAVQPTPIERLASSLPDLLRHILLLYHSIEVNLELPDLQISEATIRFCKAMAILYQSSSVLSKNAIDCIVLGNTAVLSLSRRNNFKISSAQHQRTMSKAAISDLLLHAMPTNVESIPAAEHIAVLAGIATVYGILGMERKRASTLRALVLRLTEALNQARKLGAAEMGIHPAASLSIDNGTETLLDTMRGSARLSSLAKDLASIYGVNFGALDKESSEQDAANLTGRTPIASQRFGDHHLQVVILRDLLQLCEASPDLQGVSDLVVAFLNSITPTAAFSADDGPGMLPISPEEQSRLVNMLHRALWLSKQLEMPELHGEYWDPFLVRGVELLPPASNLMLSELVRTDISPISATRSPGNPLLYDPNAPTAVTQKEASTIVLGESSLCRVTLQNPLDITVEIESLSLVTDGIALKSDVQNIHLGPNRLQNVVFKVSADAVGKVGATGCRMKIAGCAERVFPIVQQPWMPAAPIKVKQLGQDRHEIEDTASNLRPPTQSLSVRIVPGQPHLVVEDTALTGSNLMLYEGEGKSLNIQIKNVSTVNATITRIVCLTDSIFASREVTSKSIDIPAATSKTIPFQLLGKPGSTSAQASLLYTSTTDRTFGRLCPVDVRLTVKRGLHILQAEIQQRPNGMVQVQLDIANDHAQTIHLMTSVQDSTSSAQAQENLSIAPGEVRRIHLEVKKWTTIDAKQQQPATLKEELFKRIHLAWSLDDRTGIVPIDSVILSEQSLQALMCPPLSISMTILEDKEQSSTKHKVHAGSFIKLQLNISNHSTKSDPLLVQVLCDMPGMSNTDDRRVIVAGSTRRVLPAVAAGAQTVTELAICPLLSGLVNVEAIVTSALPAADKDVILGRTEGVTQLVLED